MSSKLLSPKELADAIGASESSLRRWVDAGRLSISRTAGGHRRIPLAEAIRFIRETGTHVVRPELLGLGDLQVAGSTAVAPPRAEELFNALAAGEREAAVGIIVSAYVGGEALPALFDGIVREAMSAVGQLWEHDPRGILVEHRATEICIGALARIRDLLPRPDEHAPLAMGAAPPADPYLLPSMMAGLVLQDLGFRSVNFGANTPLDLLGREAIDRRAKLVWLSVSFVADAPALRRSIDGLAAAIAKRGASLAVGGSRSADCVPAGSAGFTVLSSMAELAAFARGLLGGSAARSTPK